MPESTETYDLEGLQALYSKNKAAQSFLDHCAERSRNRKETTVDRTQQVLKAQIPDISRGTVIEMFKTLEGANCGQFLRGRRGRKSRFLWRHDMIEVGRAAAGEDEGFDNGAGSDEEAEFDDTATFITHTFHLRPDVAVEVDLPEDLTSSEAERLSKFISSLPFEID